ncbi:hypothetical protein PI87_27360 [Ralstonia sp. A12]|nr:hypothetical protein PI87_27360 [Ralstonia sp. A12]
MLEGLDNDSTEDARRRWQHAGGVFDFVCLRLVDGATPDEVAHRQALVRLFEEHDRATQQYRANVVAQHPQYASYPWPVLEVNLADASPRRLSQSEVLGLAEPGGALEQAFLDPPYRTTLHAGDFQAWLAMLHLLPNDDVEVFDWVGNADEEPARSTWSNYFDEGKEWWGIWCLTVYNPRHRTLCALAASATD